MTDIILVEGNNELNVQLVPIAVAPAEFEYASDVRQTPFTPSPAYFGSAGMKYEVDIQNIGGIAGSCTVVGHIDTSLQKNTFGMGTQVINPGQVVTFKGQWIFNGDEAAGDWWMKDGGYIVSEAGCISYKFGRSVYLVSFDIPPQVASGGEFWPTQVVHLAGGAVRAGSLPQNASPNLEGDLFMLGLTLTGIISEYGTRENAVISRCNINALHYVTAVLISDGGQMPMGDMQLLSTYGDYTVKGTYKMQILVEHNGGGVVVSINVPCKAIYMLPGPIGNYGPIPPGTYDVISTLGWSYQQTGYASWHVRPIWSYKVGQVQIV